MSGAVTSTAQGVAGYADPHRVERDRVAPHAQPVSKRIIVGYGFWIFLLSDIVMFSAFFATYAVLVDSTADGPSGRDVFHLGSVALETACLLLSSFTCGLASIGAQRRKGSLFFGAMAVTFVLGLAFI